MLYFTGGLFPKRQLIEREKIMQISLFANPNAKQGAKIEKDWYSQRSGSVGAVQGYVLNDGVCCAMKFSE